MDILRTDSSHPDFVELVQQLDQELKVRDGEEHDFYDQFNKIDMIRHTVVFFHKGKALGCGAIKEFDSSAMEVKRMFVLPGYRGKGIAQQILIELEKWAQELGYTKCILETGLKQPEAIRLYEKSGYQTTPNYGQYADVENSQCFEKML